MQFKRFKNHWHFADTSLRLLENLLGVHYDRLRFDPHTGKITNLAHNRWVDDHRNRLCRGRIGDRRRSGDLCPKFFCERPPWDTAAFSDDRIGNLYSSVVWRALCNVLADAPADPSAL